MASYARVAHEGWAAVSANASFEQVSTDGRRLCGVASESHDAFCRGLTASEDQLWRWVASDVVSIAVQGNQAWTVDQYDWVRYRSLSGNSTWRRLEGWASAVAADGKRLCTLWTDNFVFCSASNVTTQAPTWADAQPTVALTFDVHEGELFAIHPNGSTSYLPGNASYPNSAGPYQSISSDGTFVCASKTKTDAVYCVEKSQETWHPIGGRLRQVVVREGRLYGVARNGSLWTTTLKASTSNDDGELKRLEAEERAVEAWTDEWRYLDKPLKSISPERSVIWGIDNDDEIVWSFANDTQAWRKVVRESKASYNVRVASDGKTVCVLETAGNAYCAKKDIFAEPDWVPLGTQLKDIGVANGTTFGIAATGGL
ncbi:hypothetical protein ATCC90586_005022 [Pythium insidiosum]|nr:hypothetical protein ATCC90586_005022 [Pythium insidiosum]